MSDLAKHTQTRAARDPEFADSLETGYTEFNVGALLRQARETEKASGKDSRNGEK
jgi:hypothetical protein